MVAILEPTYPVKTGPTPSFFMPESVLMGQGDVSVYRLDVLAKSVSPVNGYSPSDGAFQWYQANEIPALGSWWFPVAGVNLTPFNWNDLSLIGIADLGSTGNGIWTSEGPNRMVRPNNLFWWIPGSTLSSDGFPLQPGSNNNAPTGPYPLYSPAGPPVQPTVTQKGDQITVTIPPNSEATTIDVGTS